MDCAADSASGSWEKHIKFSYPPPLSFRKKPQNPQDQNPAIRSPSSRRRMAQARRTAFSKSP